MPSARRRSPAAAGVSILARRMRRVASLHEVDGLLVHPPRTLREWRDGALIEDALLLDLVAVINAGLYYSPMQAAASPLKVRRETRSGFRPACSSRSRRTTLLLSSPRWRSHRRETASSRSPARNERRSTKSSPPILRRSATRVRSCATPRPDTSAAGSRSTRSCRWARRASAASVSTNGSAAHRQKPDPCSRQPKDRA